MIYYNFYYHKKWTFLILATKKGLKELTLYNDEDLSNYTFDLEYTNPYIEALDNYFSKHKINNFEFDITGTKFQMAIWHELTKVKLGDTISYDKLGINIGKDKSARAVGNAVGNNPILIFIPCHRVIRKDGKIGGFSSDPSLKRYLLDFEKE